MQIVMPLEEAVGEGLEAEQVEDHEVKLLE